MQGFRFTVLPYFSKVKTQLKRKKKRFAQCVEEVLTDQTCQKWFAKFLGTIDILAK